MPSIASVHIGERRASTTTVATHDSGQHERGQVQRSDSMPTAEQADAVRQPDGTLIPRQHPPTVRWRGVAVHDRAEHALHHRHPGAHQEHDQAGGDPRRGALVQRGEHGDGRQDHGHDRGAAEVAQHRGDGDEPAIAPRPGRTAGGRRPTHRRVVDLVTVLFEQRVGRRRDQPHERHERQVQRGVGAERGEAARRAPQRGSPARSSRWTESQTLAGGMNRRRQVRMAHHRGGAGRVAPTAQCAPSTTPWPRAARSPGRFKLVIPSATAAVSSSRGTRSGNIACTVRTERAGPALEQDEEAEHRRVAQPAPMTTATIV